MDILNIILQAVGEELDRVGQGREPAANTDTAATPETHRERRSLALARAELRIRRSMGATRHYLERMPKLETLQTIGAMSADLTPAQISERTGLSADYVRKMRRLLNTK